MPSRPYFHGDEEFYLLDGALIAHTPPHHNMHGVECPGRIKVLTTDRRYQLGYALLPFEGGFIGDVCADARRDRQYRIQTLEQLILACRALYGSRPRYAIEPLEENHELTSP